MIKEDPKTTILIASLTHLAGVLFQVGFTILVFRQFSLEEVGTYGLIMSIVAFVGFALDMGISQTLIRGFSQNALNLSQALIGSVVLRIPLLVLGLGALTYWIFRADSPGPSEVQLLVLAILAQILIGFRAIATAWLRAHDRQNIANLLTLLQPIGYFSIGILLLFWQTFNLFQFLLGIVMVEFLITGFSYKAIPKIQLRGFTGTYLSYEYIRESLTLIWKPSLVFLVVGFWAVIQNRMDWIMVYVYGSKTHLAYYSLANKAYEFFDAGFCMVIQTSFPWMCKIIMAGEKNPRMIIGFKGIAFLGMITALATALWLPGFLTVFWGDKFAEANSLIFFLMCAACLNPATSLLYHLHVAAGKEKYLLITSTFPALSQLIANLIFIPRYGYYGAIIGMIILILTSFILLSISSLKNRIADSLAIPKMTVIFLFLIIFMVIMQNYIKQSAIF